MPCRLVVPLGWLESGGVTAAFAAQRRKAAQSAEHALRIQFAIGRDFTLRGGGIDYVRQDLRKQAGGPIRLETCFCRETVQRLGAQYIVQCAWRYRLVLAVADPRAYDLARTFFLELLDQSIEAARLLIHKFENGGNEGGLAAAFVRRFTEERTDGVE
ncbi:MAG: hypothetical protein QOI13_675 [Paraburkholderia sp.]|nr:hypothetical protein [Paraburkholderia sp.]